MGLIGYSTRTLASFTLLLVLSACGEDDTPSNGGSGGSGGSAASGGTSAGNGGAQVGAGSGGGASAPDGFTLAPGLELLADPGKCGGLSAVACSGHCVNKDAATNGCQAVATSRIFSEVVRDENGVFFSEQRSSSSSLWRVDPASGTLVQLAEPPGDNMHLRLALADDVLYFDSGDALYSVPRSGGEPTELLAQLPNADQFVVAEGRVFAKIALDPEVHELPLAGGAPIVHNRDVTSLAQSGADIYFTQADALYRASAADFAAATMVASPATTIVGFSGDWVYALAGAGAERVVRRFPKAGGSGEVVFTLGGSGLVALANDAIAFTRQDGTRHYLCTVDLEGKAPTIHGYVHSSPSLLAADENNVYVTVGFNMARVKR